MLRIALDDGARDDLRVLRAFERAQVLEAIDRRLLPSAGKASRHHKPLRGPVASMVNGAGRALWELRVGNLRVFYDLFEELGVALIVAVRCKPPHWTTERTLSVPAAETAPGRAA